MGLDINSVRFLIDARKSGVNFGQVLTLGRLDLNVYPVRMRRLLEKHGLPSAAFAPDAPDTRYSEPVFKALGATDVSSMDASDFEGASYVHDLNEPVRADWKERFDVLFDGGTLEHVFNFPVALRNCMEMIKVGGSLFMHTVANNWCGHGFYQFSPELFFRALSPENGFKMERVIMHVVGPYGRWYEVSDPMDIRSRIELITFTPVQLILRARRQAVVPVFASMPQQSDYTPRWTVAPGEKPTEGPASISYGPSRPKLAKILPGLARLLHVVKIGLQIYRTHTMRNRRAFRPVSKP